MKDKEIVICSAVIAKCGRIIRGHRHSDCFNSMRSRGLENSMIQGNQGFITSRNRYVDRKEGLRLQKEAGIESADSHRGNKYSSELFSEDLY